MQGRMTATRPPTPLSMDSDDIESMLRASQRFDGNGLPVEYMEDWAEKATKILSRLSGATHSLEMRLGSEGGHLDAIAQQECLEKIREAIVKGEMDHDELTVQTLAHMDHLAGRLEILEEEAGECQTRLLCKCSLPQESKNQEFGLEEVLAKGRTIRGYLSDHMRQVAAANPEAQATFPTNAERLAMLKAHRGLGRLFQYFIEVPPATVKGFVEKWVAMWGSEAFREVLNGALEVHKKQAKEKIRTKKVRHEKKWRKMFRGGAEPTRPETPSRPVIQTFRSWASGRI